MLAIQRKDFDEKKPATPYPRDFARWNALDYHRRPRRLRSCRFWVTFATTLAFTLLSAVSLLPAFHRTHQAAPVSKVHAMFNQNCANCHDRAFQPFWRLVGHADANSVSNHKCAACHDGAAHQTNVPLDIACAVCHREHQGHEVLALHIPDRHLSGRLKYGNDNLPAITSFNRDHPPFAPATKEDTAKIRFSHKAHLELKLDDLLPGIGDKLECASCHQLDEHRRYMLPIRFEDHCRRCHQLNAPVVGGFAKELEKPAQELSRAPLPHREPALVRGVVRDRLVQFAQKFKVAPGADVPRQTARPLPWQPTPRVSDEQWSWAVKQANDVEKLLFLDFMNKQWEKTEPLTWCSHCHYETGRADGLPIFAKTEIPERWYRKSEFNHGSHRLMSCVECHQVAHSDTAKHVLLPTLETCQKCHHDNGGARNDCAACHRYHDRKQERSPNGTFRLDDIVRKNR